MDSNFNIVTFISKLKSGCSKVHIKTVKKGDIISSYIHKYNQICILINGSADLVRYDFNGNRSIIGHFSKNDVFGGALYPHNTNNQLVVIAQKSSEVLFFNYDDILEGCNKSCNFHTYFYENLVNLILTTVSNLNLHIELLSNKTIREKLLSYFNIISTSNLKKTFHIETSFTDLADYLNIDRSSMMRELKVLQDEGFIKRENKKITLLY